MTIPEITTRRRAAVLETARAVVAHEAQGVAASATDLDDVFLDVVQRVYECTGKVFVTGAGTSGAVARRMAHLLSVSGTRSVFISGADALHGTMGAMAPGDILVAISRGGGSDEINDLVVRAKERGVDTVVAVTADASSRLARNADVVVELTMIPGIDPGEVIAMGSTLVTAAWGNGSPWSSCGCVGTRGRTSCTRTPPGRSARSTSRPGAASPRALLEVDMDLVAGVDSSTPVLHVGLRRRDDGALVGTASAPHPRTAPRVSRQDPRAWWAAFRAAFSGALATPTPTRGRWSRSPSAPSATSRARAGTASPWRPPPCGTTRRRARRRRGSPTSTASGGGCRTSAWRRRRRSRS